MVVSNLPPHFEKNAVKNVFKNCQGFVGVTKESQNAYAHVRFETIQSAIDAIDKMNGFHVSKKNLRVAPSVEISEEIKWRKLDRQQDEYITQLQKRRETLLAENDKKLKDLENNMPVLKPRRRTISLEEFERRKEIKATYEQKRQELIDQRNEFEKKYHQLLDGLIHEIDDHRSVNNINGIVEILKNHKDITARELKKFKASLPIYAKRTEILETVGRSQVVVLIGETGSGKSTQIAQYLAEESFSEGGKVVVTQPRKIAAMSLAKRVAEEYGCDIGQEVGYHVGGLNKKMSKKTIIKFVTDRILLNEVLKGDEAMNQYSCIVIDEAHERSIHTDLLVAMIKRQLASFPHLKLIVTSATLNTDIFRRYFNDCPLVRVSGRTFPVERVYARQTPEDYVDAVYEKVVEVCGERGEEGDILVFLTQQNEIEKTCEKLQKKLGEKTIVLPLHGKLQSDDQQKVHCRYLLHCI